MDNSMTDIKSFDNNTLYYKAIYDAVRFVNTSAESTYLLYADLLSKFNTYSVINQETDSRLSQIISISTTFGNSDTTDTEVRQFVFNSGCTLQYLKTLPFDQSDGTEVVNFQTMVNYLSNSNTVYAGDPGAAATIGIGTVTTLSAGSSVTVTNSGTSNAAVFNFAIPQGTNGAAATVALGTVTTGAAGSSVIITNSGSSSAAVLNFTIPQGAAGTSPYAGYISVSVDGTTVTTLSTSGSTSWVTILGNGNITFNNTGTYEIVGYSYYSGIYPIAYTGYSTIVFTLNSLPIYSNTIFDITSTNVSLTATSNIMEVVGNDTRTIGYPRYITIKKLV
jgi:hypothetical protein